MQIGHIAPENSGGMFLEPRLFSDYQINEIPAVVVRDTAISACPPGQSCWQVYPYDVVYGDVSLEYALQTVDKQGDSANIVAHRLLEQLRGNTQ